MTELHDGPANGVRSIIEDKDGYFWFNTTYRYNVYGNNTPEKSNPDKQAFFYNREIGIDSLDGKKDGELYEYMSIAKDNNDELWIATYGAGVWRYAGKNISHYPIKDGNNIITLSPFTKIIKVTYGLADMKQGLINSTARHLRNLDHDVRRKSSH